MEGTSEGLSSNTLLSRASAMNSLRMLRAFFSVRSWKSARTEILLPPWAFVPNLLNLVPGHFKAGPDFGISHPTHGAVVGAVLLRARSWISRILVGPSQLRICWDFMASITSSQKLFLPGEVGWPKYSCATEPEGSFSSCQPQFWVLHPCDFQASRRELILYIGTAKIQPNCWIKSSYLSFCFLKDQLTLTSSREDQREQQWSGGNRNPALFGSSQKGITVGDPSINTMTMLETFIHSPVPSFILSTIGKNI